MNKFLAPILLCVTICLTGCFSISNSREPGMKNHVLVTNFGWYLFGAIPIVCGNAAEDAYTPFVIFRNDVQMDLLQRRLFKEAERQQYQVENLVWNNYDSVLFNLPFVNIPVPIPYILTYREKQLSGELK